MFLSAFPVEIPSRGSMCILFSDSMVTAAQNSIAKKLAAVTLVSLLCLHFMMYLASDHHIPRPIHEFETTFQNKLYEFFNFRNKRDRLLKSFNNAATVPDDPGLVQLIREQFLQAPSSLPYNLSPFKNISDGQSKIVDDFFKQKRYGVFVESGAFDGEFLSNTLFLERVRGWTGLLLEPDASNFNTLKNVNRKAILSNTCVSVKPYPHKTMFQMYGYLGKLLSMDTIHEEFEGDRPIVEVQCFPLQSLLLAANISSVDYFSLDVEGQEFNVLKTIPFQELDIKVLSVEYRHAPEGKDTIMKYMEQNGYVLYKETNDTVGTPNDVILVRKDLIDL
uniref:Protein Star-like n=1 Tax=Hirondellea gigas TaxID=1518452 RepID=A0A2P2IEN7_9CRUS